ncbi:MAG: hypothetical protein KGP14_03310 [Betaproteobacteria bacterium]|nr:hypothetical protein [Betaproteobacteria bacterium]
MAYLPLQLTTQGDDGMMVHSVPNMVNRPRVWTYSSTDAMSVVRAANYFSDAYNIGMKVGDMVYVLQTTSGAVTAATIAVVMTVTTTGADLSDGTAITVTNT